MRNKGEVSTKQPASASYVFLNVPYDDQFQHLYLAYITGAIAFGLVPKATLEVPGGARRLDRILELIRSCRYSFHDLSRVELDVEPPPTPRFNMPFELGLVVAWEKLHPSEHDWFVFETKNRRLQKSLSDLDGTDAYVHDGKPNGVFRELCNALVRTQRAPDVAEMSRIYQRLSKAVPGILRRTAAKSLFEARVFKDLVFTAQALATERWGQAPRPARAEAPRGIKLIVHHAFYTSDFQGVVVAADLHNPTAKDMQVLKCDLIPVESEIPLQVAPPPHLKQRWFDPTPFELKAERLSPGGFFFRAPAEWSETGLPHEPLKGRVEVSVYGLEPLSCDVEIYSLKTLQSMKP